MILGIFSDVHGNSIALRRVWVQLKARADLYVFLGDLTGYYPYVMECASIIGDNLAGRVRGNHDDIFLNCLRKGQNPGLDYRRRYGSALAHALENVTPGVLALVTAPLEVRLQIAGVKLALWHGAPWDPLQGRVYPDFKDWERFTTIDADVILLGHTHYSLIRHLGGRLVLNPGSVGQPRDQACQASYALLDLDSGEVSIERVTFDPRPLVRYARSADPHVPYLEKVLLR